MIEPRVGGFSPERAVCPAWLAFFLQVKPICDNMGRDWRKQREVSEDADLFV